MIILLLGDKPKKDEENATGSFFGQKQNLQPSELVGEQTKTDIKKIIKKPKTLRLQTPNLVTGRLKKVQFNTLPEFSTQKNRKGVFFLAEINKDPSIDDDLTPTYNEENFEKRIPVYRNGAETCLVNSKFFIIWVKLTKIDPEYYYTVLED